MQIKDVARTTRRDAAGEIRRLAIAVALADAIAGKPQLGDRRGLVELRHRAENLADRRRRRRVFDEGAPIVGGDDLDALRLEHAKRSGCRPAAKTADLF